jgi:hypothetical protein
VPCHAARQPPCGPHPQIRTSLDGYDFDHLQETLLASVSHQGSGFNPIGSQIPSDAGEQSRPMADPRSSDSQPGAPRPNVAQQQTAKSSTSENGQPKTQKSHAAGAGAGPGPGHPDSRSTAASAHLGQLDSKAAQQALQALSELAKASLETLTRQSQLAAKQPDAKKPGKRNSGGSSKEMEGMLRKFCMCYWAAVC